MTHVDDPRSFNHVEPLTKDEIRMILHHHHLKDRERSLFRALYETWARPKELISADIEDYDRNTGIIILRNTKKKWNPKTKKKIQEPPKRPCVSKTTQQLLKGVIGNRKKGPIWINKNGNRVSLSYIARVLDRTARKLGLQAEVKAVSDKRIDGQRIYHRVTLKCFREAGERHHDLGGGDSELSAKAAQHSMKIKEKHYKKTVWEEVRESQRQNHPAFNGDI